MPDICRQLGISPATFYAWRKKFGGMGIADVRHLRMVEAENRRLKQLGADLSLDKEMLQEVIPRELSGPSARGKSRTSWSTPMA